MKHNVEEIEFVPATMRQPDRTFGQWTTLGKSRRPLLKGHPRRYEWLCRCTCGIEKWVHAVHLINGASTKCPACAHAARRNDPSTLKNRALAAGLKPSVVAQRKQNGQPESAWFAQTGRENCEDPACAEFPRHSKSSCKIMPIVAAVRAEKPNVSRQRVWQIVNRRLGRCEVCPNPSTKTRCPSCTRRESLRRHGREPIRENIVTNFFLADLEAELAAKKL